MVSFSHVSIPLGHLWQTAGDWRIPPQPQAEPVTPAVLEGDSLLWFEHSHILSMYVFALWTRNLADTGSHVCGISFTISVIARLPWFSHPRRGKVQQIWTNVWFRTTEWAEPVPPSTCTIFQTLSPSSTLSLGGVDDASASPSHSPRSYVWLVVTPRATNLQVALNLPPVECLVLKGWIELRWSN
jgi:hypothetical protein